MWATRLLLMKYRAVSGGGLRFTSLITSGRMTFSQHQDGQTRADTWRLRPHPAQRKHDADIPLRKFFQLPVNVIPLRNFSYSREFYWSLHLLERSRRDRSVSALNSCFNVSPSPDASVKTQRGVLRQKTETSLQRSITRRHPPTAG